MLEMVPWAHSVAKPLVTDYFDTMFAIDGLRANYERIGAFTRRSCGTKSSGS